MNLIFYLVSTAAMILFSLGGFNVGKYLTGSYLENNYSLRGQTLGLDALGVGFVIIFGGLVGLVLGFTVSLIILHRLGRRWGSRLSFGGHPVLKLTFLSFLTFLVLLFLLLSFYSSSSPPGS